MWWQPLYWWNIIFARKWSRSRSGSGLSGRWSRDFRSDGASDTMSQSCATSEAEIKFELKVDMSDFVLLPTLLRIEAFLTVKELDRTSFWTSLLPVTTGKCPCSSNSPKWSTRWFFQSSTRLVRSSSASNRNSRSTAAFACVRTRFAASIPDVKSAFVSSSAPVLSRRS